MPQSTRERSAKTGKARTSGQEGQLIGMWSERGDLVVQQRPVAGAEAAHMPFAKFLVFAFHTELQCHPRLMDCTVVPLLEGV